MTRRRELEKLPSAMCSRSVIVHSASNLRDTFYFTWMPAVSMTVLALV